MIAARAFIALMEADENLVHGQIFNLVYKNLRVSELALRVQTTLLQLGIEAQTPFGLYLYPACEATEYQVTNYSEQRDSNRS